MCGSPVDHLFVDLGMLPLSNAFLEARQLESMERFYPLRVYLCERCFLVQLPEFESPESIFGGDYAYFSSYSQSWLRHVELYVQKMLQRFPLDKSSLVVEIASNDGYLLQFFRRGGIPVLGIEPARNVAAVAERAGIPTLTEFFGDQVAARLAAEGRRADLIVANNVLAHVPALNDFVASISRLLKPGGVATLEFPHLLELLTGVYFDTIYHEHLSYFLYTTVERLFDAHGLMLFDVESVPTHGGSLRIYACHASRPRPVTPMIAAMRTRERAARAENVETYTDFAPKVERIKRRLLAFLINARERGKRVAGYGAPAKGNTLLNYCGVRTDLLDYTVDRNLYKQGRYLPGTHIPIYKPERILEMRPDYVLILPWNIKDEVMEQMAAIRSWGGQFVLPIPELVVC